MKIKKPICFKKETNTTKYPILEKKAVKKSTLKPKSKKK